MKESNCVVSVLVMWCWLDARCRLLLILLSSFGQGWHHRSTRTRQRRCQEHQYPYGKSFPLWSDVSNTVEMFCELLERKTVSVYALLRDSAQRTFGGKRVIAGARNSILIVCAFPHANWWKSSSISVEMTSFGAKEDVIFHCQ